MPANHFPSQIPLKVREKGNNRSSYNIRAFARFVRDNLLLCHQAKAGCADNSHHGLTSSVKGYQLRTKSPNLFKDRKFSCKVARSRCGHQRWTLRQMERRHPRGQWTNQSLVRVGSHPQTCRRHRMASRQERRLHQLAQHRRWWR